MKLFLLTHGEAAAPVILEGYGRVLDIKYDNWKTDPTPNVLVLGTFVHPSTRNQLMAGINLNYLSKQQVDQLRSYLPEIIGGRKAPGQKRSKTPSLYERYHIGAQLLPDIFKEFYRYYKTSGINVGKKATLKFMTPKELMQQGDMRRGERLQRRRDAFQQAQVTQKKRERVVPARRPVIIPLLPRDEDEVEQLPPDLQQPQTTADLAKRTVDTKRLPKLATSIDRRIQAEVPPEPEEMETPEIEPEELPPEEPEDEDEEEV